MDWESILRDSVQNGKIKALHLVKLPVLKTCDNWKSVQILGWVDYQAKTAYYKGVLVKLNSNIYFVKQSSFDAVKAYIGVGHVSKIEVVP
jgi:hypothetical protein